METYDTTHILYTTHDAPIRSLYTDAWPDQNRHL